MSNRRTTRWSAKVESVYESQARELWALLYAQCCDADRAYDALQESFARLQEQNGKAIRDERAWLLRVGRNWLRDVARRQRVAARSAADFDNIAAVQAEPSTIVENHELQSRVREALARLQIEDRELLVYRYALEWSSKRIATVLNATVSAVDMRLSRARQRLAKLLEKTGVDREQA